MTIEFTQPSDKQKEIMNEFVRGIDVCFTAIATNPTPEALDARKKLIEAFDWANRATSNMLMLAAQSVQNAQQTTDLTPEQIAHIQATATPLTQAQVDAMVAENATIN